MAHGPVDDILGDLDADLRQIGGCGDGNCCIVRPKGQHTNGGCKCCYQPDRQQQRKLEKVLRVYQRHIARLSA